MSGPVLEYEQRLLGAALFNPDLLDCGDIEPRLFGDRRNALIAETMLSRRREGKPVDLLTVTETLRGAGRLDGAGGAAYVTELTNNGGVAAPNASYYIKELHEAAARRGLEKLGSALTLGSRDGRTVEDLLADARECLVAVAENLAGARASDGLTVTRAADVERKELRWLWQDRIPLGSFSNSSPATPGSARAL